MRKLLEEAAGREVVMTTITSRIPFYAAEGFERLQLKDVPRSAILLLCNSASPTHGLEIATYDARLHKFHVLSNL